MTELDALNEKIEDCLRRIKAGAPASVELGRHLIEVRDRGLYEKDGCKSIIEWADRRHGIKETQAKKYLKIGARLRPEQVAGCGFRSMAITDFGPWRSPVSAHGDHRFRSMTIT